MPFTVTEADIEKLIAENYWKIFHVDDPEPDYLKVYRQVQLSPYGVADIIAVSMSNDWDYPQIHIVEVKAVPLKEADLGQAARYLAGIRHVLGESKHKLLDDFRHPDGHIVNEYHAMYNIHTTLIGPVDEEYGHPEGANGDFVYLYHLIEFLNVMVFTFGLDGLKFECLNSGEWSKSAPHTKIAKSIEDLLDHAQEAINDKAEDKKLEEVPALQGSETSVDKTASGDLGTT